MTINYAALQDALNRTFQEPLEDLVARSNPFLASLNKKRVASDRIYLKGQMQSNHNPGAIADGSVVTVTNPATVYSNATLDWATYIAQFRVNKRVLAQVANNPGQLGQIMKLEVENAGKDLSDLVAADCMAGSVTNGLVGLQTVVDNANTYAGIDRTLAVNANWRSAVVDLDNAGTPGEISTNALYRLDEAYFGQNFVGPSDMPGRFTGITSAAIITKYKALMEDIDLASLSTAHFVNQMNDTGQLGIGKTGFLGVPFIRDRNVVAAPSDLANSSRLYMFDMSQLYLATLDASAGGGDIHQVRGFMSAPATDGLKVSIEILGNQGEFVAGYVKTYVQLATANPKKAGMLLKNVNIL